DRIVATVQGPENTFLEGSPPLEIAMRVSLDRARRLVHVDLGDAHVDLTPGQLSDWVRLRFRALPGIDVTGLSRLLVTEMGEHFSLYMSPICIDPEKPAMPIAHPSYYATYLAKRIGPYSTLGLAEDTWALNEGVIDDGTFLKQTYDIDHEGEPMFFGALDRLKRGSLVCVFDATDRIQHMFWRYTEQGHPAAPPGWDARSSAPTSSAPEGVVS